MIDQRRTVHHMDDRRIRLMPLARESNASRKVGALCGVLMALTVLYFVAAFCR